MSKQPTKKPKPVRTPKQELFCQLYIRGNKMQFGNATQSYIDAYDIDIHMKNEDGTEDKEANRKAYNVARSIGSENLSKPNIKARIKEILQEAFQDDKVDEELTKIITQNNDLGSKLAGIKEYNRLKERVIEKPMDINVFNFQGKTLKELDERRKQLLKKK